MRKLVVTEFMSLDGVVEAPGGEPVSRLLTRALEQRLEVVEVAPRYETLEDLFVRSGAGAG